MVSAVPSDRSDFRNSSSSQRLYGSSQTDNWEARVDSEQMFQLIDTLLPFEACLYHQVLPLSIEKTNLHLGMVSPDDGIALEYVRRILTYVHYSLITHRLPNDIHQNMLSAYLNYVGKRSQQKPAKTRSARPARKVIDPNPADQVAPKQTPEIKPQPSPTAEVADKPSQKSPPVTSPVTSPVSDPEPAPPVPSSSQSQRASFYQDDQATLITDLDDELPLLADPVLTDPAAKSQAATPVTPSSPAFESSPESLSLTRDSAGSGDFALPVMPPSEIVLPPTLELNPRYLTSPIADLVKLPATDLVAELLARVLAGGIGRLFFEQQQSQGRILWSQNGTLQATLEGLVPDQMNAIVDELKILSNLSLAPLTTARQIEIERIYQNARLLLRFRFMPGNYGEEATLQVLRGAALKFHHQQQSTGTGHELLGFAEHLQRKVDELLDHAESDPSVLADDTLSRLRSVVMSLGDKLSRLEALNYRKEN